jgi:predicted RNase H-like HicB family nuclease
MAPDFGTTFEIRIKNCRAMQVVAIRKVGSMSANFTVIIQRDGDWWIGWVEEILGVNSQGETREELLENLRSALKEALELNRAEARAAATGTYEEVCLSA